MTAEAGPPLPDPKDARLRPYWEAAARGEFRLPACGACQRIIWYPEPVCPRCGHDAFAWDVLSGRGRVFSFVVIRRALHAAFADLVPYVAGIVTIDEDPEIRVVTRFLDADPERIAIDMPVRVRFADFGYPLTTTNVIGPFWEIAA